MQAPTPEKLHHTRSDQALIRADRKENQQISAH